jgi:membrane protein YdbS with pleckstrin-like domain
LEYRVVPISRVHTVDTARGPIQRIFGLSTVLVTTASSRGAVKIEQLDGVVANELVTKLTEIASARLEDTM